MLLIGMPKHLGQPRQASHKLNKRQFKKGCGYKEISKQKPDFGFHRDKGGLGTDFKGSKPVAMGLPIVNPKPYYPTYGAKTYKKHAKK